MPFRKARTVAAVLAALAFVGIAPEAADAAAKKDFKVCWSIYVGWMPWGHIADAGIMKKWAEKYGITVEIVQINDYVESINQYTAGEFDGCTMTNMDALSIPAAGGVDTTALIIGDFSNGNDGIILKDTTALTDIKGMKVNLVELSVSHYLLARALDTIKLTEKDITVVNTSDADMVSAFVTPDVTAVVTWNPLLSEIANISGANEVFNSSRIPGEIIDIMMVNTETLRDNPDFGKALVGAWYEMMEIMKNDYGAGLAARTAMATASGTDIDGFNAQLRTTEMFYTPAGAVAFARDAKLVETMRFVAQFLFDHGILGEGAKSADAVGMEFPGGKTLGDTGNIKLRFDPAFMALAAEGKL